MHGLIETSTTHEGIRGQLARFRSRVGLRALLRLLRREAYSAWIGPLAIAAMLALLQQAGLFASLDARFFDVVTTGEPGRTPRTVIVERDEAFEALGAVRFGALDKELRRLGAARIGYLADVPATSPKVITARSARYIAATGSWELTPAAEAANAGTPAARVMAQPEYGITRRQIGRLATVDGNLATFETALSGKRPVRADYFVRMPRRQSIPQLRASQLVAGHLRAGELAGTAVIIADRSALSPKLATPLTPNSLGTSEAVFRAHAINALQNGRTVYTAPDWQAALLFTIVAVILAVVYRRSDPKQLALAFPLALSLLVVGGAWAALQLAGKLLPVTGLLLAPWLVTFQRVLAREARQDRRLEDSASRAVQLSFSRSALREGARLPAMLGAASHHAGVDRSLLFELHRDGTFEEIDARNASLDDLEIDGKSAIRTLRQMQGTLGARDASSLVPQWDGDPRIVWLSSGEGELYWVHSHIAEAAPGNSAHLLRAIIASFRELFRWRADLNGRARQEDRYLPVDDKISSAIALVAGESEQVRRGFDRIDTAVAIFHLIGAPLHANSRMQAIYREAGLIASDASIADVLLSLTELGPRRVNAMIEDLMRNGGEMRMPMIASGPIKRTLRIAAPSRHARASERVIVIEAIDVSDLHRAADLRQAVAHFIDLQLRNDFEAILLGSDLAADDRVDGARLKPVVKRIGETARRATARLDEVAGLVRAENSQLVDACYPVDARKTVSDACARVSDLAEELGVSIEADLPDMSGFTIAEPHALSEMLVAMLRVVIADTPQGGKVRLTLQELLDRTHIRVAGGFGIGFGRLMWLLSNYEDEAVGEYRTIGEGMAKAVQWDASVSYWGREADGFGFNVELRRIG